jgi:hypothetical protein
VSRSLYCPGTMPLARKSINAFYLLLLQLSWGWSSFMRLETDLLFHDHRPPPANCCEPTRPFTGIATYDAKMFLFKSRRRIIVIVMTSDRYVDHGSWQRLLLASWFWWIDHTSRLVCLSSIVDCLSQKPSASSGKRYRCKFTPVEGCVPTRSPV